MNLPMPDLSPRLIFGSTVELTLDSWTETNHESQLNHSY